MGLLTALRPLMRKFSAACAECYGMVTISQSDVAPLPTPSRCFPHSTGFPVQMRHGDGCTGAGNLAGTDRFVDARSEGWGGDQSAGAKSPTVSSSRETGHSHFPQRRTLARRYVRSETGTREIRVPTPAGRQSTDGATDRRGVDCPV